MSDHTHPTEAHRAACPACNPDKTVPELNEAFRTSNSVLAKWGKHRLGCPPGGCMECEMRAEIERLTRELEAEKQVNDLAYTHPRHLIANRNRLRTALRELSDETQAIMHGEHGADWADQFTPLFNLIQRAKTLSDEPNSAPETAGEHVYEADILQFLGWISGDFPEMHAVEVPRLKDSWERFKRIRAALLRTPEKATAGHPPAAGVGPGPHVGQTYSRDEFERDQGFVRRCSRCGSELIRRPSTSVNGGYIVGCPKCDSV